MKIISIVVALLLAVGIALAEPPEEAWVMCQPDSEVIIRETPSRHAKEAGRLWPGERVELTGNKRGRWYEIFAHTEVETGWVRGDFLSFFEPMAFPGGKLFTTTKGNLITRMSMGGDVRNRFKRKGVIVRVYMMAEEWSVTNYGYIKTRYLEAQDGT